MQSRLPCSSWPSHELAYQPARLAHVLGARTLLVTMFATRNKCIATSNKCLTSSNKKLVETIYKPAVAPMRTKT